ncbi:MAG: AbrB/MazE/SpoVT family DNA-binding domain-containing protein [Candidatus Micrarchaeota archaeon]
MPVVTIDALGRLLIPKQVRESFNTRQFYLHAEREELRLTPVKSWDELFGSLPSLSARDLKKMRTEDAANDA